MPILRQYQDRKASRLILDIDLQYSGILERPLLPLSTTKSSKKKVFFEVLLDALVPNSNEDEVIPKIKRKSANEKNIKDAITIRAILKAIKEEYKYSNKQCLNKCRSSYVFYLILSSYYYIVTAP